VLVWPPEGDSRRQYLVVAVAEPFWLVIEACMTLLLVRCLFATRDAPVSPHNASREPLRHMSCWVAECTLQRAFTNRFTTKYISGLEPTGRRANKQTTTGKRSLEVFLCGRQSFGPVRCFPVGIYRGETRADVRCLWRATPRTKRGHGQNRVLSAAIASSIASLLVGEEF